jgi:predicted deacylase
MIPTPLAQATPLAGSETLRATAPGIVVFAAQVGQVLKAGDVVAEVINPITGTTQRVKAGVDGIFYARIRDRYVTAGSELGKIAGATPFRTGELLGA